VSAIPPKALAEFAELLKHLYSKSVSVESFEQEASRINPKLVPLAKAVLQSKLRALLILAVLAAILSCHLNMNVNADFKIKFDVEEVVKLLMNKQPLEIINRDIYLQ
jgi:hypothetical protein